MRSSARVLCVQTAAHRDARMPARRPVGSKTTRAVGPARPARIRDEHARQRPYAPLWVACSHRGARAPPKISASRVSCEARVLPAPHRSTSPGFPDNEGDNSLLFPVCETSAASVLRAAITAVRHREPDFAHRCGARSPHEDEEGGALSRAHARGAAQPGCTASNRIKGGRRWQSNVMTRRTSRQSADADF